MWSEDHGLVLAASLTEQYIHRKPPLTVHILIVTHLSTIYIYIYTDTYIDTQTKEH